MKEELYKALGEAKCEELAKKSWSLWHLLGLSEGRKSAQVRGVVQEGIARDFIREFLPQGFGLKSGLVFDAEADEDKKISPQIDAIIYRGAPLLEFSDVAVVEKEQVKAIFEIKSYIDQTDIFGSERKGVRNPNTGVARQLNRIKDFLPPDGRCILFTFELHSRSTDAEVIARLKKICDSYGVVIRRARGARVTNFDGSIGRLIEWLRNLS